MLEYEWAVGRDCLEPGSRVQEARQAAARGPSNSNYQQRAAVLASSMLLQSSSVLLSNLFQIRVTSYSCIQLLALFYLGC
jgi:hypothetical protein